MPKAGSVVKQPPTGEVTSPVGLLPLSSNFLTTLPEKLSTGLLASSTLRSLKAGELLFLAGDPGDGLYRVEEGLLKVSIGGLDGAERILAILGPGAFVGDLAILDGLPRSASVGALRDSKVRFVSRPDFDSFAERNPEIYKHLVRMLAARLRNTDSLLAAGSFLPLQGRVARALLDLATAFGKDVGDGRILIHQKLSQSDVAAIAGVARENVSRILKTWTTEKLVSRLSGYYCLENRAKIAKKAEL
jgi:CRP/FNR family transcriptional regulator, cyclic AMP receptor protein